MALHLRYNNENDPENKHYEAWSKGDDPDLLLFIAPNQENSLIQHAWKTFTRAWTDETYTKHLIEGETIH